MTETNTLVGRIIASTKRKKRTLSIVEIAQDIRSLKTQLGSIQKVADIIGISVGMLNQFLSVFNLPTDVQVLVNNRKIDSVAVVFTLSKFSKEDIHSLIEPITNGRLTSQDLKALLPYRKQHKNENLLELIDRLKNSKNIKAAVIRLPSNLIPDKQKLETALKSKVGEENYLETEESDDFIDFKVTKQGEKVLRQAAKDEKSNLQQFILRLLNYV
ncbi:MAG TPA: hypothetical protein VNS32_17110 [Flavisolibacter sp.]|nr:hypothetical protein [Flavisolibacter sp.]